MSWMFGIIIKNRILVLDCINKNYNDNGRQKKIKNLLDIFLTFKLFFLEKHV